MTDDAIGSAGDPSADAETATASDDRTKRPAEDEINQRQEKPARESRLGAAVGQWGAVIAAFVAAISAIVTAIVAANTSVSTTHSQSHASAILAERQERKDAYAKYYNSLDDLEAAELQAEDIIQTYKPEVLNALNGTVGECNDKFIQWMHLDGGMLLVDSTEVEATRSKLLPAHMGIMKTILSLRDSATENKLNPMTSQIADLGKKQLDAINLEASFALAAKADLLKLGYGE